MQWNYTHSQSKTCRLDSLVFFNWNSFYSIFMCDCHNFSFLPQHALIQSLSRSLIWLTFQTMDPYTVHTKCGAHTHVRKAYCCDWFHVIWLPFQIAENVKIINVQRTACTIKWDQADVIIHVILVVTIFFLNRARTAKNGICKQQL